jgi:MFS family permease
MTDRYARINHGYFDEKDCSEYTMTDKPKECLQGSADAQNAVAMENLISNILTFLTSSLLGSISDMYGRKRILVVSMIVCTIRPVMLVMIQIYPQMSPIWYYAAGAMAGLFNWIAIALSSLSDVMPKKWRAPSFGLLMAGFALGFAIAPQLALLFGHYNVSLLSLTTIGMGLLVTMIWLPETLPADAAMKAQIQYNEQMEQFGVTNSIQERIIWNIYRPIWELSILNRNRLFRLLTSLAFFSSFVSAGE